MRTKRRVLLLRRSSTPHETARTNVRACPTESAHVACIDAADNTISMQISSSSSPSPSLFVQPTAPPQQLTYSICATEHVEDLDRLVSRSLDSMNAIHAAAAIVRLANLITYGVGTGTGESDARRKMSAEASTSTSSSSAGLPVRSAGQKLHPGNGHGPDMDLAASLMARLASKYQEHCDMGSYAGARQHANIAWAIGKMGMAPPPGILDRIADQLTEDKGRRLDAATPQELSNLALGLARTSYSGVPLWSAIVSKAPAKLEQFNPQELSNLAWACVAVHQQQEMGGVRGLVRDIARHSSSRVASFKPQELSSLLRAVAKTGLQSEQALFDAAAKHCIQLVKQQGPGKPTPHMQVGRPYPNLKKPITSITLN